MRGITAWKKSYGWSIHGGVSIQGLGQPRLVEHRELRRIYPDGDCVWFIRICGGVYIYSGARSVQPLDRAYGTPQETS